MPEIILTLHVITAYVSIISFLSRGVGLFFTDAIGIKGMARWLPHANDALLALSGAMLVYSNPDPDTFWLAIKFCLVLVYVLLGMIAFDGKLYQLIPWGNKYLPRMYAWFGALIVAGSILILAVTKQL
tara:strand:+ start:56 stop:439 length:384 start_codon:yes stop_codon:yes gene_type:complete